MKIRNKSVDKLFVKLFILLSIANLVAFVDKLNIKNELEEIKLVEEAKLYREEDDVSNKYKDVFSSLEILRDSRVSSGNVSNGVFFMELEEEEIINILKSLENEVSVLSIEYLNDELKVEIGGELR